MGYLITVEGGEYVGKSSVAIPAIVSYFKKAGYDTITSREPGGTPKGEVMRAEIFALLEQGASALRLTRLFNKARKIHIDDVIRPHLGLKKERKAVVVLDRYLDSTRVYQGLEGGVSLSALYDLEKKYVGSFFPDVTLLLFFPENVFEKTLVHRMKKGHGSRDHTGWDKSSITDHLKRQKAYLSLPKIAKKHHEARKFALIDASKSPSQVAKQCIHACKDFLEHSISRSL